MRKIITAVVGLLIGLGLAPPAEADGGHPNLLNRLAICHTDEVGDALAPYRPCVWLASYQGNGDGDSLLTRRGGRIQWISEHRATNLFLIALYRNEEPGTRGGSDESRMNVCYDPDGGSGSTLPCVFDMGLWDIPESSVIVRRSGRVQEITNERARQLTLIVAYRYYN